LYRTARLHLTGLFMESLLTAGEGQDLPKNAQQSYFQSCLKDRDILYPSSIHDDFRIKDMRLVSVLAHCLFVVRDSSNANR